MVQCERLWSGTNWAVDSDEMAIACGTGAAFQGIAALALGKDAGKRGRGANSVAIDKLADVTAALNGSKTLVTEKTTS
ncbi:hypothetical protein SARC_10555 [Sphaeroforma arctica JP610]|uniref:Uncharacterized protein n=1 Tax=Sphaeroforma arctica JP610 TaxID=667725 RepID=A0A0L0FJL0_9EUKA|nr:hypothetical protein SARC_10555 [Sphaeroforma arctica JP610]KNC76969.1 hypothetical protein SARC_10555 [Sphaeroforma arctica JP610]|eukprot:XP_014150871.1 hypothetical protein SARC_10555 [Sphaeroforma arctica JP610]